nr:hypothetical protein Iba_chr04dCG4980 [Ipomoea batatas]
MNLCWEFAASKGVEILNDRSGKRGFVSALWAFPRGVICGCWRYAQFPVVAALIACNELDTAPLGLAVELGESSCPEVQDLAIVCVLKLEEHENWKFINRRKFCSLSVDSGRHLIFVSRRLKYLKLNSPVNAFGTFSMQIPCRSSTLKNFKCDEISFNENEEHMSLLKTNRERSWHNTVLLTWNLSCLQERDSLCVFLSILESWPLYTMQKFSFSVVVMASSRITSCTFKALTRPASLASPPPAAPVDCCPQNMGPPPPPVYYTYPEQSAASEPPLMEPLRDRAYRNAEGVRGGGGLLASAVMEAAVTTADWLRKSSAVPTANVACGCGAYCNTANILSDTLICCRR